MLNCPLCAGADLNEVFHVPQSPVSIGLLRDTCLDEIESVEIALVQCLRCGHVFNACFDVAKISEAYVSDRYVVKRNVSANMNNVEGKIFGELETFLRPCSVWLEIGSGSGALANHIAPRVARIVTIDPSPCSAPVFCPTNRFHIQDFFSKGYFPSNEFSGIVFRHLLEHIADPNGFIVSVADILETGGYVYVEVPNFTEIHSSGRFLDIFHDHFSYFSEDGLVRLFEANGFQAVRRLAFYDDQHQGIIFRKGQNQALVDCTSEKLFHGDKFRDSFETFSVLLSSMASRDNLVVWGAGAPLCVNISETPAPL